MAHANFVKKLLIAFLLLASTTVWCQSIASNDDYERPVSHMFNINFGSAGYAALGYTYESNRKIHWVVDAQATWETAFQVTGGYRIGTELYNITPMLGATQWFSLENDVKSKGLFLNERALTGSIRAQVWILNASITKRTAQQPIISIGLRGNLFK